MADNSGIIKIGIFGAAAYYAYTQGWLSFLGIGTPATTTATTAATTTPATTTPVNPNPIVGANTVTGIEAAVILAAQAPAEGLNVDEWDYYVNNVLASQGKVAPDPMPIFTAAVPGFDRSQKLTAAQYWGVMAPALKSQLGLSGLGLYRWVQ